MTWMLPEKHDPLTFIRRLIGDLMFGADSRQAYDLSQMLLASEADDCDFVINTNESNEWLVEQFLLHQGNLLSINAGDSAHLKVMVNYFDEVVRELFPWIQQYGASYGFGDWLTPRDVILTLFLGQNELAEDVALLKQLGVASSLRAMFSVGRNSEIDAFVCLSDVPQAGFEVGLSTENYAAIISDPVAVFRSQAGLQSVRNDLHARWESASKLLNKKYCSESMILFDTDQYTYRDVLTSAYQLVGSNSGKVVNDIPCFQTKNYTLVPILAYGSHVFPFGNVLALIENLRGAGGTQVAVIPDSFEWRLATEIRTSVSPRVHLVMPPDLPVTQMSNKDARATPSISSKYLRDSNAHFGILLGTKLPHKQDKDWYLSGREALEQIAYAYALSEQHATKLRGAAQYLTPLAKEQQLVRLLVRFPMTIVQAYAMANPHGIAEFAQRAANCYLAVKDSPSIRGPVSRMFGSILYNAMDILGFHYTS